LFRRCQQNRVQREVSLWQRMYNFQFCLFPPFLLHIQCWWWIEQLCISLPQLLISQTPNSFLRICWLRRSREVSQGPILRAPLFQQPTLLHPILTASLIITTPWPQNSQVHRQLIRPATSPSSVGFGTLPSSTEKTTLASASAEFEMSLEGLAGGRSWISGGVVGTVRDRCTMRRCGVKGLRAADRWFGLVSWWGLGVFFSSFAKTGSGGKSNGLDLEILRLVWRWSVQISINFWGVLDIKRAYRREGDMMWYIYFSSAAGAKEQY